MQRKRLFVLLFIVLAALFFWQCGDDSSSDNKDTTAPSWLSSYPTLTQVATNSAQLNLGLDEAGTAYFRLQADGTAQPNPATVKASPTGTVVLSANVPTFTTISNLSSSTSYDVYVVAEDSAGNLQATAVLVEMTTPNPAASQNWDAAVWGQSTWAP